MAEERQAVSDSMVTVDLRAALRAVAAAIRDHRERREDFRQHDSAWHVDAAEKELDRWNDGDDEALSRAAMHALYALQIDEEHRS